MRIVVSKKMSILIQIIFVIIGLIMGHFVTKLLDGWKLLGSILLLIIVAYIICFKLLPSIYEENENNQNKL